MIHSAARPPVAGGPRPSCAVHDPEGVGERGHGAPRAMSSVRGPGTVWNAEWGRPASDTTTEPTMSTGFPEADAESDFSRHRRRKARARIAARRRSEPDDVSTALPFE